MTQNRTITALDIGSTKICCFIAGVTDDGTIYIKGMSHQASIGIKNGIIINMQAANQTILSAIHSAEQMAGHTIDNVTVNVTGGFPKSIITSRKMNIGGGAIRDADIKRLLQDGRMASQFDERSLIHAIPIGYQIDDAEPIANPRGLYAENLSLNMHLITAKNSSIQNLNDCIAKCHLEIDNFVASPYAAGLSVLVEDERDLGATIIDMGGGTTSIAVFYEGSIVHTDTIAIGGIHISNDIASILSTSLAYAEKLKTLHGNAIQTVTDERDIIDIIHVGEDENETNQIPKSHLLSIIIPRIEETFELIKQQLDSANLGSLSRQRIILTGGASQLSGIRELAQQILSKQVRLARPLAIKGLAEATSGPAFATAAGLLTFAADSNNNINNKNIKMNQLNGGILTKMGGWFRENF